MNKCHLGKRDPEHGLKLPKRLQRTDHCPSLTNLLYDASHTNATLLPCLLSISILKWKSVWLYPSTGGLKSTSNLEPNFHISTRNSLSSEVDKTFQNEHCFGAEKHLQVGLTYISSWIDLYVYVNTFLKELLFMCLREGPGEQCKEISLLPLPF